MSPFLRRDPQSSPRVPDFHPMRVTPGRLALIYVIASGLWIVVSSNLVLFELETPAAITRWEVAKGLAFILASGALVYWVTQRLAGRLLRSQKSLRTSQERAKRLEHQLIQAQKLEALGQLAGGVAHDFNNIMQVITSNIQLLERDGAAERPRLQAIRQAADQAASLTHQLFAFSRRQQLQPRALNLNEIVQQMGVLLKSLVGSPVKLAFNLEPRLWQVLADPDQMSQVLMNLCVNARDAMPHGGTIAIQTRNVIISDDLAAELFESSVGPTVVLSVKDTGTGIPPEVRDRMFEPFFTTKVPASGTGFGLSIVLGVVKQSGGFIDVHSEPGKGSEFLIYLPRFAAAGDASNLEPVGEQASSSRA